ncbi:MAG: GyrI-like domain-containing protein [Tepidiformaceae bacterium]
MTDFAFAELEARTTAVVVGKGVPVTEISVAVADILLTVAQFLHDRELAPIGPPFLRYTNMTDSTFDLEGGFPVAAPIDSAERVVASDLPAGQVAIGWHIGPYTTIGQTYDALVVWAAGEGRTPIGDMWEVYWSDPEVTPPGELRTQVFCPVR